MLLWCFIGSSTGWQAPIKHQLAPIKHHAVVAAIMKKHHSGIGKTPAEHRLGTALVSKQLVSDRGDGASNGLVLGSRPNGTTLSDYRGVALQGQHIRYVTIGHGQIFMKYEHRHLASLGDHAPSTGLPYVSHGHPVVVGHSFQDVLGIPDGLLR